MPKLSPNLG